MPDNIISLPHIAAMVYNTPLMISEAKLQTIMSVLGPRLAGGELVTAAQMRQDEDADIRQMRLPADLDEAGTVRVVPVDGILMHKVRGMDAFSGMASYEKIIQAVREAHDSTEVDATVLDLCSPGGMVQGAFDAADVIKFLSATKPIYAIINEEANSAAYLLASAANKIYVTRTAVAGSIGVRMQHVDISELNAKMGVKYTDIFSGARKLDFSQNEPLSRKAREDAQMEVDDLRTLFATTVAENRDLPLAEVLATEAAIFVGQAAVNAGLADTVMSVDDAFTDIFELITNRSDHAMPKIQPETTASDLVPKPVLAAAPDFDAPLPVTVTAEQAAHDAKLASQAAVTGERTRISSIYALPESEGRRAMADQCVDMGMSVEDAQKLLKAAPGATVAPAAVPDALAAAMASVPNPDIGADNGRGDTDMDDDTALIHEILANSNLTPAA